MRHETSCFSATLPCLSGDLTSAFCLQPPRPTLSINLYVKGCLDCTTGAFHMSILSKSSLLQNEVQILNDKTWWWQCLASWHCRSVWSLPCHFAADACSALSMAKSRWNGALRSTHKSCTHSHMFWKRGGVKRELVADPWTSSRLFSHVLWLRVHSHRLLRACLLGSYHLKLVRSDLDFLMRSAIQGACSSLAPCTSVVRVIFQALEPTAFLVHLVLAAIAEDAVAAHSSVTDDAWKLAWTLQEVQSRTADHDLCLSCIYSQSFLLHCFFPSQEPPDTFLKRFSDDNKVIGIEVLLGDPRVEFSW